MSATTVENYDENTSNSQSVISTKESPENIESQTSLSLARNLDNTKHENLAKISSNDNPETQHFGEDKNTPADNAFVSTRPFIQENVIIVQHIKHKSQKDVKAPESHRAKTHDDKNAKLPPAESKNMRNCTTPREQVRTEPKLVEEKTVFCPKPTCRKEPDEYVPPEVSKPDPKPDVPTNKHPFDIILDKEYEKQKRMEKEERTVCVTPKPTPEVPPAPKQKDQLCMAPECPVVLRKSVVKEAKRSEKKHEEKPKNKRPSILGGILPKPFVGNWQECKLTRQEKKVLKRMMQLEREEAEGGENDRYRRKYGHDKVRCFPKMILEEDPNDPARYCGIAECPITIQKMKIREFLNNGRLCATPHCPIAAPPEPEELPPPRPPSPPPRVRSITDCPERSCFLSPKNEEYLRNMDPAIYERYPRLMLECKDAYTQANVTTGQQSAWNPGTNTRDTEYNTVVAHFQVASTHANPLLPNNSDWQAFPVERTVDQTTGTPQFGYSRDQPQLLPPRTVTMKSNYRNKSKMSVLRDKLADIMRPKYKVEMHRRNDRRASNTRERTNRSVLHGPRLSRDQDEVGGCCSARPNTSQKPTGFQLIKKNGITDESATEGGLKLAGHARFVELVRENEFKNQIKVRTISMMHKNTPAKSESMEIRLSERFFGEEFVDPDSNRVVRNVKNVLEGSTDDASDAKLVESSLSSNSIDELDNAESTLMHQHGKEIANSETNDEYKMINLQNYQTKLTTFEYVASARQQNLIPEHECRGIQTSAASAVSHNARVTVAIDSKLSSESK